MTRRALFAAAFAPRAGRVPTDESMMNRFAERYNAYAEMLKQGVVDTAAWRRVDRAWHELVQ